MVAAAEKIPVHNLSLAEALRLAKERHIEVLVAEERVQQALARIGQARSGLLPQLEGTASEQRKTVNLKAFGINPNIPGFNPDVPPFNVFDARISLQQNLFDLTVLRRLSAAKAGQRLSVAEQEKTREDVLALVADMYLEAQRAEEAADYVQALQRQAGARLRIAEAQHQLGLGSDYDVTQARAELATAENQVAQARRERVERSLDLIAALGLPPDEAIRYSSRESWLEKSPPSQDELKGLVEGHPDLRVAKQQVDLNVAARRQEVAEYFPKVGAHADYGASGNDPSDSFDTYSYGGQLSVPIYQGGLTHSRVQEATSKVRESEWQRSQVQQDTLAQALQALNTLRESRAALNAARADLTKTAQGLGLAQQRLSLGVGNELQVVEAQAQVANAKDQQSEALATYRLAWVNLKHRLGQMRAWTEEMK